MPGNWHVRFGKRRNETDRRKPTRRVAPTSPLCAVFEPATTAASMAIEEAGDDRRRTRSRAAAQRRTPEGKLSCLARNARSKAERRGRKFDCRRCGIGDRGDAGLWPDRPSWRRGASGRRTAFEKEKTWLPRLSSTEVGQFRRYRHAPAMGKRLGHLTPTAPIETRYRKPSVPKDRQAAVSRLEKRAATVAATGRFGERARALR